MDIERALQALGELLDAENEDVWIVVVGGSAMILLGFVIRATQDVDVIALAERGKSDTEITLHPPDQLPPALTRGIARVARDFGISKEWMNTQVALQWKTGLPEGLERRLTWKRYGGLHAGLISRKDLIFFKLYAAADRGPDDIHYQDLLALKPTRKELEEAAQWAIDNDTSSEFAELLSQVLKKVDHDLARSD